MSRVVNAIKTDGGFPSKLEKAVYDWLALRQQNGEISALRRQAVIVLQSGDRSKRISWRVDFAYFDEGLKEDVFAEAKGYPTEVYKLKLKMFRANPVCRLEIWGGNWRKPKIMEIIERKIE